MKIVDKQRIFEHLSTAILVFDKKYKLVNMNPAGEMLLGISQRQARGLRLEKLFTQTETSKAIREAVAYGRSIMQRAIKLVQPGQRENILVDVIATHADDDLFLIVEIGPSETKTGKGENLLDQFDATRQVLRGLAHEVKNPLGGLRGAAQLLDRELDSEELKEYTGIIMNEADRLQKLLDRILLPHNLPKKELCNIHEALERVRNLTKVEASQIRIDRDYDPSIPDIHIDPDQIIQATLNLVRNAIQAISSENGQITLRTRTERQYTIAHKRHRLVVRVDVEDNGAGIPPDLEEKIFYPMVTGRAQGTGLGLPIAHSLIKFHGGSLECQSEPGKTIFSIFLPLENGNGE